MDDERIAIPQIAGKMPIEPEAGTEQSTLPT